MSEAELDCQTCGACCSAWRPQTSFVPVSPVDAERLGPHRELVVVDPDTRSGYGLRTRTLPSGVRVCAALEGDPRPPQGAVRCGIYEARPEPCRAVQAGSDWCRTMRARRGFEAPFLASPERDWLPPAPDPARLAALAAARVSDLEGTPTLVSTRYGRRELDLDAARSLRIYEDAPELLKAELRLLSQPWRELATPEVLARGPDFLVLRRVAPEPLRDSSLHAAALGRALAEVHTRSQPKGESRPSCEAWLETERAAAAALPRALADEVLRFLQARAPELRQLAGTPTQTQGAWGVASLGWAAGRPYVADWSRARVGPALLDLGRLLRWGASADFLEAFAESYRASGRTLPDEWRQAAGWFDVCNLSRDLAALEPGSPEARVLRARLERAAI